MEVELKHEKINCIEIYSEDVNVNVAYPEYTRRNIVTLKRGARYIWTENEFTQKKDTKWVWFSRQYTNVTPASLLRCFWAAMKLEETWRKQNESNA